MIVNRSRYYYGGGAFCRPYRGGCVVVGAPIGARVRYLPYGYVVRAGERLRCFFGAGSLLPLGPVYREYVVVERPRDAAEGGAQGRVDPEQSTRVYAYPKNGRGEAQADRDR